jgi:hypothetical protein
MSVSITTRLKANVIKAVIEQLAGPGCILEERPDSIKLILQDSQKKWFQDFLNAQLDIKTRPDIEIDAMGIILPVIIKRVWPILAAGGAGIAALVLGSKKNLQ